MRFSTIFTAVALVAFSASVGATPAPGSPAARRNPDFITNRERISRGLPLNPPTRRAPGEARRAVPSSTPPPECKPLLQSCSVNSECCADVCLAGLCL
ncbi:uncharacterized protein STEHIDRAFT_167202 [Stereum hirsutum FP-91666 SS1]|uniref:uncharacterized protein n=1 Tax=Stereum hirsutum (strain FP-91666) TaxID=721885 RepID=UPI000440D4CA|nr:uncharacterized protein STEHIDRAFT_167202 [Stereum hirsutum FP-91666 SS1]EIM89427.1 hypothetical protein STEHIDRAFT_167202 [Stereum hirsutum FP-91666 SS1]